MSAFLTRQDLQDLTELKQRSKIKAWLIENGYKFELAADGWPKVLWAAVEAKLMPSAGKRAARKTEPDFNAYATSKKTA